MDATRPPTSPHEAHQQACWAALWRLLLRPLPPPDDAADASPPATSEPR